MGIDVGFSGGVAILNMDGKCEFISRMFVEKTDIGNELDYISLSKLLSQVDIIYIEKQNPMPKNGVKEAFRFGGQFFALRCMVRVLGKKVTYVISQRWKNIMLENMDKRKKESSTTRAQQLFPNVNLLPGMCKKPHDGIAEALLIAEYGAGLIPDLCE